MADGPRVAIRLGIVGDAEVKATLDAIGETGEASAKRAGAAYARSSKDVEDALARQAKAAEQVNAVLSASGSGTKYTGDQNAQVKAYQQYMEQQRVAAEGLRNAIDPLRVAQAAYDRELEVSATLLRTGNITEEEHAAAVALSTRTLQQARGRLAEHAEGFNRMGASGMIAEHVVRSFSDSVAAGQSPIRAATMEMGRVTEALTMWAAQSGQTEGKVGALAAFMGGPWGLALSVGIAVITPLVAKLFEGGDAADANKKATESLTDAIHKLNEAGQQAIRTSDQSAQASLNDAKAKMAQAQATLQSAMANLRQQQSMITDPNAQPETAVAGMIMASRTQGRVNGLVQDILNAQDAIKTLQLPILQREVAAATDNSAAATQRYERTLASLNSRYQAGTLTAAAYRKELEAATRLRDQTTDAHPAGRVDHSAERAALREQKLFSDDLLKGWGDIEKANVAFSKNFADQFGEQFKQLHGQMETDQKTRMAPGEYGVHTLTAQQDALTISQAELATVGMNADQRQRVLDTVKATIDLQRNGLDLDSDDAKAILAGVEAQDRLNEAIQRSSASMQEVRDFASQFVDDLASGKNVVKDLEQEFIKLALLNPLKNLINGNSAAPTLGSVFGSVSKLFGGGGGSSAASAIPSFASIFAGFASGTDYAPGGLAWVGENGPELMNVPRGASITPAGQSRRIMDAANNNQTHVVVQVQAGQMFDATVASISDTRIGAAAPVIADGGAKLGNRYAAQMRRRKLGRY